MTEGWEPKEDLAQAPGVCQDCSSMRRWELLAATAAAAGALCGQTALRKADWGMTQAEVMASEAGKPASVREIGGETAMNYDSEFGGIACRVIYFFSKGKLTRAKLLFAAEHEDLNLFITDYHAVEPALREKYGKPAEERAVWDHPAFQTESQSYLERDRSIPAEIMPSDKFAGLEIALGHLKLYTQWTTQATTILHALTGEDHRMTHQIELRSAAAAQEPAAR